MGRLRCSLLIATAAMLLVGVSLAQKSGGSSSSASTTTTTTVPKSTSPSLGTTQRSPQQLIFLRGDVRLDDGTTPSERVAIERVCNGVVRREAYTDTKGTFSFQVGGLDAVFQDASVGTAPLSGMNALNSGGAIASAGTTGQSGVDPRTLLGCEIRGDLSGFRSDSIVLGMRHPLDDPNIGTIVLHRLGKIDGTTVSLTSLEAPKDAKKALENGIKAVKKNDWQRAEQEFTKATQIYPKYAEAWWQMGMAQQAQNRADDARASYQKSIEADDKYIPPYFQLAQMAAQSNEWKPLADLSDKVLALDAYDYPIVYFENAVAYYNLGNMQQAEKSARMAQRLDSQHRIPRNDLLLGNILANKQDYPGAAEQLRNYLKVVPEGPDAELAKTQLASVEKLIPPPASAEASSK